MSDQTTTTPLRCPQCSSQPLILVPVGNTLACADCGAAVPAKLDIDSREVQPDSQRTNGIRHFSDRRKPPR